MQRFVISDDLDVEILISMEDEIALLETKLTEAKQRYYRHQYQVVEQWIDSITGTTIKSRTVQDGGDVELTEKDYKTVDAAKQRLRDYLPVLREKLDGKFIVSETLVFETEYTGTVTLEVT